MYDFHEFHQRAVPASASDVFRAIKELNPAELAVMNVLMSIRLFLTRRVDEVRSATAGERSLLLQGFLRAGFLLLAEERDREIVIGRIGQFWRLSGGESPRVADADAFVAFERPGFVKVAANFRLEAKPDGSANVSTETRIAATDASARRRFNAYWTVIYPGSALIRREWLPAIGLRASRTSASK